MEIGSASLAYTHAAFTPVIRKTVNVFLALVMLSVYGCASNSPPQGGQAGTGDQTNQGDNYQYVIGPGDMLDIFVWGYPDLSVKIPVRPDGKITTRLVEDLAASGKTPTQLARELEQRFQTFVNKPTVTVSIDEFVGTSNQQVKVVGGGDAPRTVPYTNGMTLLDLMITVGGLGEFSSGNKSVLVRKERGVNKSYKVLVGDLLQKGDISANVPLLPGDILIIPESWF